MLDNSHLTLVSPTIENRTVAQTMPLRRPNAELRSREFLTPAEVEKPIEALHVSKRKKNGRPSTHTLQGDEIRALRRLRRECRHSEFVFISERGSPFSTSGFAKLIERAGESAELGFKAHPHMLRHACGYALANKGHDTRSLQD
jgi:integrase